jgi:ubiquinone/menaquinone biosynthesis C-methylase UbiE
MMEEPHCAVCGSVAVSHFSAGDFHLNLVPPLAVKRCSSCSLLFMSPRPGEQLRNALFSGDVPAALKPYSSVGANYGSVTDTRAQLFKNRVEWLKKTKGQNGTAIKMLDVGASSGVFVEAARKAGVSAFGIEPSTEGVQTAASRGIDLVQSVAEKMPFEDASFDVVHSHHVFEHLANPLAAATEIFRVTKPGGLVFIEVPNQFDNIRFFRDRVFGRVRQRKRNIRSIHHLYFFSRSTLKRLFKEAGFKDVRIESHYSFKPRGVRAVIGYPTTILGRFYLGGEIVQAIATK